MATDAMRSVQKPPERASFSRRHIPTAVPAVAPSAPLPPSFRVAIRAVNSAGATKTTRRHHRAKVDPLTASRGGRRAVGGGGGGASLPAALAGLVKAVGCAAVQLGTPGGCCCCCCCCCCRLTAPAADAYIVAARRQARRWGRRRRRRGP